MLILKLAVTVIQHSLGTLAGIIITVAVFYFPFRCLGSDSVPTGPTTLKFRKERFSFSWELAALRFFRIRSREQMHVSLGIRPEYIVFCFCFCFLLYRAQIKIDEYVENAFILLTSEQSNILLLIQCNLVFVYISIVSPKK